MDWIQCLDRGVWSWRGSEIGLSIRTSGTVVHRLLFIHRASNKPAAAHGKAQASARGCGGIAGTRHSGRAHATADRRERQRAGERAPERTTSGPASAAADRQARQRARRRVRQRDGHAHLAGAIDPVKYC